MVKSRRRMVISAALVIAGAALIALALVFYQQGGTHMGGGDSSIWYGLENMILGLVGAFLLGCGSIYAIMGEDHHLHPSSVVDKRSEMQTASSIETEMRTVEGSQGEEAAEVLVLRLLDGDERRMFMALRESGGEALQKDLIGKTKMSNAKVTRVLDRLEEKGLIVKERYGMTNRVRIDIER